MIKIGIIGGTRGLGRALFCHWRDTLPAGKYQLETCGQSTDKTAKDFVESCDIVVFAVPIRSTIKLIDEMVPYSNSQQLWTDITSIKTAPVEAMMRSKAQVCGLHPLFSANGNLCRKQVVKCPARLKSTGKKWLHDLLSAFDVKEMSPNEHDRLMAMEQSLPYFLDMINNVLWAENPDLDKKSHTIFTSSFLLRMMIRSRWHHQSPLLSSDLITSNPYAKKYQQRFVEIMTKLWQPEKNQPVALEKKIIKIKEKTTSSNWQFWWEQSQECLSLIFARSQSTAKNPPTTKTKWMIFGQAGSNTDRASYLTKLRQDADTARYSNSIDQIFFQIERDQATYGIVPYENSNQGVVLPSLMSLLRYPSVKIVSSVRPKINHCLLGVGHDSVAKPQRIITDIYSHSQALAQCSKWLNKNLPHAQRHESSSTAAAAEYIATINNPSMACIADQSISASHNLQILQADISPPDNRTRFIIISKKEKVPRQSNYVSALFWLVNDKPGSLLNALEVFARNKLNLKRLTSIPHNIKNYGDNLFVMDIESSVQDIEKIIPELQANTAGFRILGGFDH